MTPLHAVHRRTARRSRFAWAPLVLLVVLAAPAAAQRAPDKLAGRRLSEALLMLEASGLHIVFTSELVTPDMRVDREPKARTARDKLVEVLEPHGLGTKEGADDTIVVIRKPKPRPGRAAPTGSTPARQPDEVLPDSPGVSDEVVRAEVMVVTNAPEDADLIVGSSRRFDGDAVSRFSSHVGEDPMRMLQTLPGVGIGADVRSEISVRGSPYRHTAVVIDGMQAPWLQHAALGRPDGGTLTMLRSDVVQEASLRVGAYARRDGNQLGPQVSLTLREGSRDTLRWRAETSDWAATVTGEGPIGSTRRGSWLIGLRRSYTEWPLRRSDHEGTVFGVGDLQSKLVYDVRPSQQITVSLIAGESMIERDDPAAAALADGLNRAAAVNVGLRSLVGADTVVRQRASLQVHTFENRGQHDQIAGRGAQHAGAYRIDVSHPVGRHVLDAGFQVRSTHGSTPDRVLVVAEDADRGLTIDGREAAWWEHAGYVSFRWNPVQDLSLVSGARIADSTLTRQRGLDRWLQAEWSGIPRWRLFAAAGVAHQFTGLEELSRAGGQMHERPERASYVDAGIGRDLAGDVRLSATLFTRRERDIVQTYLVRTGPLDEVLSGVTRGIDVTVERTARTGLTGWIGYSFSVARYTDDVRRLTYRADLDQRHVVTVVGSVPIGTRGAVGLTFRAGSRAPIPGYLVRRDEGLFVLSGGDLPNRVDRPVYSRLDLRGERRFEISSCPVIVFGEVINVLNHRNYGLATGVVDLDTGRALGFTGQQFPRLVTAGVGVEF